VDIDGGVRRLFTSSIDNPLGRLDPLLGVVMLANGLVGTRFPACRYEKKLFRAETLLALLRCEICLLRHCSKKL